jgi:AcrR family transcriptional regulator
MSPRRTSSPAIQPRHTGPRAEKLAAIQRGARGVFGREGYAQTTIEAIAAEAGVSTRTIYNHFESKEQLFAAILQESATHVADSFITAVARDCVGDDAYAKLVSLAHAFVARRTEFPEHFALIDRFRAEAANLPAAILDAWQSAGPRRVEREVTRQLQAIAKDGLLAIDHPHRTANHFMALLASETSDLRFDVAPQSKRQTRDAVAAALTAFLNGYAIREHQA